ncbi:hypothetical protein A3731_10640 [Roseovarius sp. HI0049]|nr:hypothetical protein A3731_11020 [Roseovarius sp. HI0049]KZY44222.1 hypothetical protein A3731_10640 [Roseovarius sp. HI0049]
MKLGLPPLNSLRAFEVAARHLSFKRAAEELNVTPAAISQQIRALEDSLGQPLFKRLTRALALTDAGAAALPHLTSGFEQIATGVKAARRGPASTLLTVSVAPSFAAKWLVPRLSRFYDEHPELDVRIDVTDALAGFERDGVDIALRYGRGQYPDLMSECLVPETTFPVCSPCLLERGPKLENPADLAHHTLLHVQWKMERDSDPNWRMWMRAAGVEHVNVDRGPRYTLDSLVVQAAVEGQGVALASAALVADDLAAGRLVRPFPPSVCDATEFGHYLVYPPDWVSEPKVKAFRDWVVAEASTSLGGG